jgi:hypothetical protein
MPAPAHDGDQVMLGHLRFHRRHVDDLSPGHIDLDRPGQAGPASRTGGRHVPDHHVRIGEAFEGDTVLAFRPSRTPA